MARGTWRRVLARLPLLLLVAALTCGGAPPKPSPSAARDQGADFDALAHALDTSYPGLKSNRDWNRTRATWRARAQRAATREDFLATLEGALAELRDDAIVVTPHSKRSGRVVPYETDIWARWADGAVRVEAVRISSEADSAGVRPGHIVTRVEGVPVDKAVEAYLKGGNADALARDWALRRLLAGPRIGPQLVEVREGDVTKTIVVERGRVSPNATPPFVARRVGDGRDIAYVRLRIGAAESEILPALDETLPRMADTRGMILDLRDNPRPGSGAVTSAILSRFDPAAGGYRAPIVVLVDRWTAREGEALAAGLQRIAHATLIGTPTAGVAADLTEVTLPNSHVTVSIPARRAEPLQPAIAVDMAAPSGGPGDPILYQGLKTLEALPARAGRNGPR